MYKEVFDQKNSLKLSFNYMRHRLKPCQTTSSVCLFWT